MYQLVACAKCRQVRFYAPGELVPAVCDQVTGTWISRCGATAIPRELCGGVLVVMAEKYAVPTDYNL